MQKVLAAPHLLSALGGCPEKCTCFSQRITHVCWKCFPLNCTGVWIEAHIQAILGQYGVCVLPRDGDDVAALINNHQLLAAHRANIRIAQEAVGFAVSSTLIRDVVRAGKSARYFTPDQVLTYVKKNRLWSKY